MTIIPFNSGAALNGKRLNGRKLFTAYFNASNKDVYVTDCGLYFYHDRSMWCQLSREGAELICVGMLMSNGFFRKKDEGGNYRDIPQAAQDIQVRMWMA